MKEKKILKFLNKEIIQRDGWIFERTFNDKILTKDGTINATSETGMPNVRDLLLVEILRELKKLNKKWKQK